MAVQETGTVKWFDPIKRFGFIEREEGNDVFMHANEMADPTAPVLKDGERVTFELVQGQKGPAARNVRRTSE